MVTSVNNSTSSISSVASASSSTSASTSNSSSTSSSSTSAAVSNTGSAILSALGGAQIDIQSLATNLVSAERAPLQKLLDDQKMALDNKISSIGRIYASASDMKNALATFGTDPRLAAYTPQTSDASKASFVFKSNPTNFNLTFAVQQLATDNTVTLEAFDTSNAWPTSGQLVITQGQRANPTAGAATQTFNYSDYTSIEGLRDAVNAAGPYKAQILTTLSPTGGTMKYLTISRGTGAERNFYVSTADAGAPLTSGLYIKPPVVDAQNVIASDSGQASGVDAILTSGGHEYRYFKNSFSDLVPGVTINVNAVTDLNKPVTLSTNVDTSKFTAIIRQMVSSYNDLQGTISNEIKYDADITKRGGLSNDYVARNFLQQMRRMTTDTITKVNNNNVSLTTLGVSTNADGTLSINETKLAAAAQNPDLMEAVIASSSASTGTIKGAFQKMNDFADMIMGKDGSMVKLFDQTQKVDLKKVQDKMDKLNTDMDALKQRYLNQFISMQDFLTSNKAAQSSLTQSMAAWTASMKA